MEGNVNVFGEPLIECSYTPLTGYFRDGCCNTDETDHGRHTVCVVTTEDFLQFSYEQGNDLTTPAPQWGFPGLKPGDRWCLFAARFLEAHRSNCAPKVVLEATNEKTLDVVPMEILIENAFYSKQEM